MQIKGAILWDILSPAGKRMGQAVRITQWQYEDGRLAGPDAPVSEADVAAAGEMGAKRQVDLRNTDVVLS